MSGEEPNKNLFALVKTKLVEDGVLQDVRCMLHANIVNLMGGDDDGATSLIRRPASGMGNRYIRRDIRLKLLNQLILEYFNWRGLKYSADMLARESDIENVVPLRDCLEGMVGPFHEQDRPILLEIISQLIEMKRTTATTTATTITTTQEEA